jgi:hypothetical protein
MAEIIDLREFDRAPGEGVVAQVGDEFVEVINVSVAGIRLARPRICLSRRDIEFRIIPCVGAELDFHRAIPVWGHIVGDGPDHLRIAFAAITPALANVIGIYDTALPLHRPGALPPLERAVDVAH